MEKKQQEIDNYNCLISVFSDYEKYTLVEYTDNDDSKLIFYNPKNTELCTQIIQLVTDTIYNILFYIIRKKVTIIHT